MINQSLLSIRTISNIYNFKLYRIDCKLKAKYISTIEKTIYNCEWEKENQALLRKKLSKI